MRNFTDKIIEVKSNARNTKNFESKINNSKFRKLN